MTAHFVAGGLHQKSAAPARTAQGGDFAEKVFGEEDVSASRHRVYIECAIDMGLESTHQEVVLLDPAGSMGKGDPSTHCENAGLRDDLGKKRALHAGEDYHSVGRDDDIGGGLKAVQRAA